MAKQNYIFYEKTNPFAGFIRFVGHIDPDGPPDGSTMNERLDQLLIKYPDSALALTDFSVPLPDPEAVKYDEGTGTLVPLEPGDITPKAQAVLDEAQKEQDIIDNLPSWSAINNQVDNIKSNAAAASTVQELKIALAPLVELIRKHLRVTYWSVKNSKD